jgi:hypothetical protein
LDRTGRKGEPEQDSQNGTSRTGKAEDGIQLRTAKTGLPGQDCQDRACQDRTARPILQYRAAKTLPGYDFWDRQSDQFLLYIVLSLVFVLALLL